MALPGLPRLGRLLGGELPELRHLKLRREARRARVAKLRAAGANISQIADGCGASIGAVHGDLKALEGGHQRAAVSQVKEPAGRQPRADQVVELVAARGATGVTVRELCKALRVHHGIASGALSRLGRQGRVTRTGVFRDGCAAYTAGPDRPAL